MPEHTVLNLHFFSHKKNNSFWNFWLRNVFCLPKEKYNVNTLGIQQKEKNILGIHKNYAVVLYFRKLWRHRIRQGNISRRNVQVNLSQNLLLKLVSSCLLPYGCSQQWLVLHFPVIVYWWWQSWCIALCITVVTFDTLLLYEMYYLWHCISVCLGMKHEISCTGVEYDKFQYYTVPPVY